jgi:GNAT superfamily N-acetyltransferase
MSAPTIRKRHSADVRAGARVRDVLPTDIAALRAMHDRCGLESRYNRWFAPVHQMPDSYLARVTSRSGDEIGVVATTRAGTVIGLASAFRIPDGSWDIAVLVEDVWQHRGIGTRLIDAVVDRLRAEPMAVVSADVLLGRRRLLERLGRYGVLDIRRDDDILHGTLLIGPPHHDERHDMLVD